MKQLKIIEKDDVRVLTSPQLAEAYGTDYKAISNNYNRNKERYEEGKHYITLTGEERKMFLNNHQIDDSSKHAHTIYLWTKQGALLHAKSLNTNLAWEAYTDLVDDYFRKVEQVQKANMPFEIPTTIEGILELSVLNMKDLRTKLDALEEKNRHLTLVVDNEVWITDHQRADIKDAVKKRVGYLKGQAIEAHFQGIFSSLNTYFNVPKYDKIKRSDFEQALEFVKTWFPKKKENSPS